MQTMEKFGLRVDGLLCNGLVNPIGTSCCYPFFRWKLTGEERNVRQTKFHLQVATKETFKGHSIVYDLLEDSSQQQAEWKSVLEEKTRYYWRVRCCVYCEAAEEAWTDWSETASFETALLNSLYWKGKWIEADEDFYKDADAVCRQFWLPVKDLYKDPEHMTEDMEGYPDEDQGLRRIPYLKKEFQVQGEIEKARVYITARGLYELNLNGKKVGQCALAPDFTAYDKCIYYQTYDLTGFIRQGINCFDILLGDGWYVGHAQGIPGRNHLYGKRPSLIMQAEIWYKDGRKQETVSDESFKAYTGPLLYADMFVGEYLDLQQEAKCYGTVAREYSKDVLMPQKGECIEEVEVLPAIELHELKDGSYVADFGQVHAGKVRIRFENEEGRLIKIECSEILNPDGSGDILNPVTRCPYHVQTDYVKLGKEGTYLYEPKFSFQGYRYIKISGMKNKPRLCNLSSVVLQTALKDTCSFRSSNPDLNRLVSNTYWSQRGNMISIPTDCPQRERGGFTGDAQIYCTTAAWFQDVSGFFLRWLEQCRLEQLKRGQVPIVVPYTVAYSELEPNPGWTSAGWGDAIIFIPCDMYNAYGDIRFLEENFEAMEKWMDYVSVCAAETMPEQYYRKFGSGKYQKYLWNTGFHWGDWLMPGIDKEEGIKLSKEITASLYYFREACVMTEVAKTLGKEDRARYYAELKENIKNAFHMFYITKEKRLTTELQGLYVMAIAFGMVEGEEKATFANRLNELVEANQYHLATGFLSTPFLLDVLWDTGYRETAYKVLYQESCPSWLYEVKKGATTIWEEWDGIDEKGNVKGSSFNHYAFGCVCDFIFRRIAGVERLEPGFRKVRIHPEMTEGLDFVEFSYETLYGKLEVNWEKTKEGLKLYVTIPHGMTAVITGDQEIGSGKWTILEGKIYKND
ncbi:MAG TPA: family 78 glycoside hydrolase catalytic domain [Clostridiaceae bacterium]|nr:family 78 glycoside hydrolase catalytic domain [Clostridiaceae bacterium]